MLDPMVGEVGFELAYALLASFALVGIELGFAVGEGLAWAPVLCYGLLQGLDCVLGCCLLEDAVCYDES